MKRKKRRGRKGQVMSSCVSSHWGHMVTGQGCQFGDVIASSHGEKRMRSEQVEVDERGRGKIRGMEG